MNVTDLNEQERNRRESLGKLRELGIDPYPAALYPVNATAGQIKEGYDAGKGNSTTWPSPEESCRGA